MKTGTNALRVGVLMTAAALLSPAFADPGLLPADTVFALGLRDAPLHQEKFEPFLAEWNRLELSENLTTLLGSSEAGDLLDDDLLAGELPDMDIIELLGESAWLSVSLSSTNPLPHVTFTAQPSGEAHARLTDMLATLESDPDALQLQEGGQAFWFVEVDEELTEGALSGVAVSLSDDLLVVSSNPDLLRGVLRRQAGASEPSLATSASFDQLTEYTSGHLVAYVDATALASTLSPLARPFATEFGVGSLLDELVSALETIGVIAGSSTFTADGVSSVGVQLVGDSNDSVRSLLLDRQPATTDVLEFVPAGALTVSSGFSNPTGWWNYLNATLASNPELGIGSLDDLLLGFVGLDLRAGFFNWVGNEMTVITTGLADATAPGVAADNLLGENLYVLRTASDADAQTGLDNIMMMASMLIGSFTSLDGSSAGEFDTGSSEVVAGTTVRTYNLTDGVIISYAVTDGFVLIGTDQHSVADALQAHAAGGQAPEIISRMLQNVPAGAVQFAANDSAAMLESLAEQIPVQVELLAGLSGQGVDFAALDAATSGLEQFVQFLAERAGGDWSYTVIDGNAIVSESFSEIDW